MMWHIRIDQHLNQFGIALTTSFVDPRQLPDEQASYFLCGDCGAAAPQVHLELSLLVWTATLVVHMEEPE